MDTAQVWPSFASLFQVGEITVCLFTEDMTWWEWGGGGTIDKKLIAGQTFEEVGWSTG